MMDILGYLPPHEVVSFDIFRPREFTENDVIIALNDLLFVDVILPQQTQGIGHGSLTLNLMTVKGQWI